MKLLVNEAPLQLLPSVVHEVGMNEALFLQQLHFRSLISKNIRDGHKWVYNTYGDWLVEFSFWSYSTMTRIIYKLEEKGYLISTSAYNRMKQDRTKWYRIDYTKFPDAYAQIEECDSPKRKDTALHNEKSHFSHRKDTVPQNEEPSLLGLKRPLTKELKTSKNKTFVENNLDVAQFVINYLNDKTGKQFKADSTATRKFIHGRMSEGYTQQDFMRVIDHKTNKWLKSREFNQYLRPSTLFNATNFENYMNELTALQKVKKSVPQSTVIDLTQGED